MKTKAVGRPEGLTSICHTESILAWLTIERVFAAHFHDLIDKWLECMKEKAGQVQALPATGGCDSYCSKCDTMEVASSLSSRCLASEQTIHHMLLSHVQHLTFFASAMQSCIESNF